MSGPITAAGPTGFSWRRTVQRPSPSWRELEGRLGPSERPGPHVENEAARLVDLDHLAAIGDGERSGQTDPVMERRARRRPRGVDRSYVLGTDQPVRIRVRLEERLPDRGPVDLHGSFDGRHRCLSVGSAVRYPFAASIHARGR